MLLDRASFQQYKHYCATVTAAGCTFLLGMKKSLYAALHQQIPSTLFTAVLMASSGKSCPHSPSFIGHNREVKKHQIWTVLLCCRRKVFFLCGISVAISWWSPGHNLLIGVDKLFISWADSCAGLPGAWPVLPYCAHIHCLVSLDIQEALNIGAIFSTWGIQWQIIGGKVQPLLPYHL